MRGNEVIGNRDLRMSERGNGIHLWAAKGSVVEDNDVRYGRDGIFVTTSRKNAFRNNRFRDLRFAIHYMYTHDSEVSGNVSHDNHVGYALMYSDRLRVFDNRSTGDRDHGFLFNFTNKSRIERNLVRAGRTKCVFLYNANRNVLSDKHLRGLRHRHPLHRRLRGQSHRGQRLRWQRDPGKVRRHAPCRVVRRRASATTGATILPSTSTAMASATCLTGPTTSSIRWSGAIRWPSCC